MSPRDFWITVCLGSAAFLGLVFGQINLRHMKRLLAQFHDLEAQEKFAQAVFCETCGARLQFRRRTKKELLKECPEGCETHHLVTEP